MKVIRVLIYEGSVEFIQQQFDKRGVRPGGCQNYRGNTITEIAATWPSEWLANSVLSLNEEVPVNEED